MPCLVIRVIDFSQCCWMKKKSVNNYSCKTPDVTDSTNHFSHSYYLAHLQIRSTQTDPLERKIITYRFMQEG